MAVTFQGTGKMTPAPIKQTLQQTILILQAQLRKVGLNNICQI